MGTFYVFLYSHNIRFLEEIQVLMGQDDRKSVQQFCPLSRTPAGCPSAVNLAQFTEIGSVRLIGERIWRG